MCNRDAEDNPLLARGEIAHQHIDYESIPGIDAQSSFQISIDIITAIKTDFCKVEICLNSESSYWGDNSLFNCIRKGEACLVGAKYFLQTFSIQTIGSCRQPNKELTLKILETPPDSWSYGMMCFIHHNI
ncbi:hypothetical protein SDC9_149149 [bioreactor metagenome]|uniref:Uncharacterized protein n=1 Tax=bioreactor metagenome TaxID=1076179 RepID=A0A645EKF2_9ZZZZ